MDKKFLAEIKPYNDRSKAQDEFNKKVEKELQSLKRRQERIKDLFSTFEKEQKAQMSKLEVFSKKSSFFEDLLEFDVDIEAIKEQLNIDREITESEIQKRIDEKKRRMQEVNKLYNLDNLDD